MACSYCGALAFVLDCRIIKFSGQLDARTRRAMKFPQVDLRAHEELCRDLAELGLLEPIAESPGWRVTQRGYRQLAALLAVGWLDRSRPKFKPKPVASDGSNVVRLDSRRGLRPPTSDL
jgi:hypothetical protein